MIKGTKKGTNSLSLIIFAIILLSLVIAVLFVKNQYWMPKNTKATITYSGTLPCADCSGLVETITLIAQNPKQKTGTYVMHDLYEGKMTTPIITEGSWLITKGTPSNPQANVLNLITKNPPSVTYYLMNGTESITLLDQNKQKIDSPFNETLTNINDQKQSQLANPASENCVKQGGTVVIQKRGDGGEYGLCQFDDNRACEEWAMYRGECPVGGVKTTGYDTIEQKYCAWSGGQTSAVPNAQCKLPNGHVCSDVDFYNGTCQ